MSEGAAYCYECGGNLAPVKNSDARSCWNCGWITAPAINKQIDALHATIQTLHGLIAPLAIRVNELDALEAQVDTLNKAQQMALSHIQTLEAQVKALNGAWWWIANDVFGAEPALPRDPFEEERNTNPAPALMILPLTAEEEEDLASAIKVQREASRTKYDYARQVSQLVASQSREEYAKSITDAMGVTRSPLVAKDPAGPEPTFVTGTALRCPVHGLSVSPGSQPFNSVDDPSGKCYSCGSTLEVV